MMHDYETNPLYEKVFPPSSKGLGKLFLHHYVHEITPISETECKMRSVLMVDPNVSFLPESVVKYGSRFFNSWMISKMLGVCKNFKGSKYE